MKSYFLIISGLVVLAVAAVFLADSFMSSQMQPVVETKPAAEPANVENNTIQKAVSYPAYPRFEAFIDRPDNKTPATQGIDAAAVAELKDDVPLPQKTARFISNSNDPRIQSLIKAGRKPTLRAKADGFDGEILFKHCIRDTSVKFIV